MIQSADQTGDTSELTKESKSGGSEREPTDAEPHRSLFFRLQKYGCRKFPSFIPDPERHGRLEMYRSRDADNNAKSEPPSDEVVDLRCVWLSSSIPPHKSPNCFAVSKVSAGIPMTLLDLIVIPRVGSNVIANRNTVGVGSISDQSVGPVQVHTSAPTEKHPCRLVWSTHKRLCIA